MSSSHLRWATAAASTGGDTLGAITIHAVNYKRSAPSTSRTALRAKKDAPAFQPPSAEAAKPATARLADHDDNKAYNIANGYDVNKSLSALAKSDIAECSYEFLAIKNASNVVRSSMRSISVVKSIKVNVPKTHGTLRIWIILFGLRHNCVMLESQMLMYR